MAETRTYEYINFKLRKMSPLTQNGELHLLDHTFGGIWEKFAQSFGGKWKNFVHSCRGTVRVSSASLLKEF